MPLAEFRGFVLIEAQMHAKRDARALESIGETEIGGRVIGGISAQDN